MVNDRRRWRVTGGCGGRLPRNRRACAAILAAHGAGSRPADSGRVTIGLNGGVAGDISQAMQERGQSAGPGGRDTWQKHRVCPSPSGSACLEAMLAVPWVDGRRCCLQMALHFAHAHVGARRKAVFTSAQSLSDTPGCSNTAPLVHRRIRRQSGSDGERTSQRDLQVMAGCRQGPRASWDASVPSSSAAPSRIRGKPASAAPSWSGSGNPALPTRSSQSRHGLADRIKHSRRLYRTTQRGSVCTTAQGVVLPRRPASRAIRPHAALQRMAGSSRPCACRVTAWWPPWPSP